MNISKKLSLLHFVSLFAFTAVTTVRAVCPVIRPVLEGNYIPVNPQQGENLWQMTDRIGSSLDTVGPMIAQSASELNDLAYTSSLCCPCLCFITQADVPNYIITEPGVYCVAEPITLGNAMGSYVIDVQADNVVIDFRGNKISVSNSAAIVHIGDGHRGVVIKNAFIDVAAVTGFLIEGSAYDIVIENCHIRNTSGIGLSSSFSRNILIENCVAYDCFSYGFNVQNAAREVTFRNCRTSNNGQGGFNPAFRVNNECTNVTFDSCYSYDNNGDGFLADLTSSAIVYLNCQANINFGSGFVIDSNDTRIQNCVSFFNSTHGFSINPSAFATSYIEVVGSVAYRNAAIGIRNGLLARSFVFNCVAAGNTTSDYLNVTAATLIAPASVTTATGYWSNIDG